MAIQGVNNKLMLFTLCPDSRNFYPAKDGVETILLYKLIQLPKWDFAVELK